MSDAFELDDPTVAAGNPFSGKNSSLERSLRARKQPRDKKGRWVPTGAALTADLRLPDGTSVSIEGKAIGGTAEREGEKNFIRMLMDEGYEQYGIEKNTVVEIDPKNGELKSKVQLDRDYLMSKGIDPDLQADLPEDLADQPQTLEEMNPQPADDLDIELANTGLTDDEDKERRAEREAEPVAKLSPAVAEQVAEGSEVSEIVKAAEKGEAPKAEETPEDISKLSDEEIKKRATKEYLDSVGAKPRSDGKIGQGPRSDTFLKEAEKRGISIFDLPDTQKPKSVKEKATTSEPNTLEELLKAPTEDSSSTTPEDIAISNAIDEILDGVNPADVIAKLQEPKTLQPTKQKTAEQLVEGDVIQFNNGTQAIVRKIKPSPGSQGAKIDVVLENENGVQKTFTSKTTEPLDVLQKPDKNKFKKKPTPPRPKASETAEKKPAQEPKAPPAKPKDGASPESTEEKKPEPKKEFVPPTPKNKDDGKDFSRPEGFTDKDFKDAEAARKIPVARDMDGNVIEVIDENGKKKPAQDIDAVLATIFDIYPDAKINDKGEVVLERGKFTDPDGTEHSYTTKIARTNGGGYLVGVEVTTDGKTETFWHRSERQSLGAIKPFALTDYITGKAWPAEGGKPGTPNYKTYFEPGTLAARMAFLRNTKMRKIDEKKLLQNLADAQALPKNDVARDIEILKAEYMLNKFRTEFSGNVDQFSEWYRAQSGKTLVLTMEELVDKMATGFAVNYNYAEGDQFGNVLRSGRQGLYEDLASGNWDAVASHLLALGNKLPTWARNEEVAQNILDKIRKSYKSRFPEMNSKRLGAVLTNAFKSMWTYSDETANEKPHISFDGKVLRPGMLVEFLNNNDQKSIGRIRTLSPQESGNTNNVYFDYVFVEYVDKNGNITDEAIETVSKSLVVVDDTDMDIQEAKKMMTTYTPWIAGEAKLAARFGKATDENGNKLSKRVTVPKSADTPEAVQELAPDPISYSVDEAGVGSVHIGKDGSELGIIVTKKSAKDKDGNDVWIIVYRDEDGQLKKTNVKKGTVRTPKK